MEFVFLVLICITAVLNVITVYYIRKANHSNEETARLQAQRRALPYRRDGG